MKKVNFSHRGNKLKIYIYNDIDINIYHGMVDISELVAWFLTNEHSIKNDNLPWKIVNGQDKSIASAIKNFYELLDPDKESDDMIDTVYYYRSSHGLRFGCRGIDFPDIYIGKNKSGHEISFCSDSESWRYFIDIDDLFFTIRNM